MSGAVVMANSPLRSARPSSKRSFSSSQMTGMAANISKPGSLFNGWFPINIQSLDGGGPVRDSGAPAPAAEHLMAVYTDVAAEDLAAFLAGYDIWELLSYKGIAEGVENSNFLVHTSRAYFILTLYERRVASEDLPFFLGLMEHLHARGISCPQPVKNKRGEVLGRIASRPAAVVTFLDGMWIRRPSPAHCGALGEALARLHLAGLDFKHSRANALSVDGWRSLYESCSERANEVQPNLKQFLAAELSHLETAWPSKLPQGVIHADLFPDNVFFLGNKLSGLIDFYF